MPKIRLLAPTTYKDKPLATGAEVTVDEETYRDLRARGMASSIEDEEAQAKASAEGGNYSARTARADVPDKARTGGTASEAEEAPKQK